MNITGKGMKFRWLNNAALKWSYPAENIFQQIHGQTRHRFILSALMRLNGRIMFFSPIHMMTIQTVSGRIQKRFPQAAIFVGDLSAEALCKEYDLNVERLFRIRGREEYEFDDVKIEVISARHTESKGRKLLGQRLLHSEGRKQKRNYVVWFPGNVQLPALPMLMDTEPLSGAGMTTEEQIHRMEKYRGNEIAFMHVSPKQDHQMFARLDAGY